MYHTRISYRTRMVHTIRVYPYGTTVRVWYGYLYHMRIASYYTIIDYKQQIAIASTVLLFILDHKLYPCRTAFCGDLLRRITPINSSFLDGQFTFGLL